MRRAAALLVGLLLFTAGCGHPLVPKSLVSPKPTKTVASGQHAAPILGVDLYSNSGYKPPQVRFDGLRSLTYIKRFLHAQSVGLVWNLYSPSTTSAGISQTNISLTPAEVGTLTRLTYRLGMTVEYRPVIRVGPKWDWEGHLNPTSQHAFFSSLFSAEAPYLRLAQRMHVTAFVVGTELTSIAGSPDWPAFLAEVKSIYHGTVTYASYEADYVSKPAILPGTSQYGLDAYPNVNLPPSASIAQLVAGWDRYFGQVPATVLAKTTIEEIGIPGRDGAYRHPSVWTAPGKPDPQVQARWFTTACQVALQYHMQGLYFYDVNLTDNPAKPDTFAGFFEKNKGSQAIRACRKIFQT